MAQSNAFFAEQVARTLQEAGYSFEVEPSIGGLRPDFLITLPNDRAIVIESKAWPAGSSSLERALDQVRMYRSALGTDAVYMVLPEAVPGAVLDAVIPLPNLVERLRHLADLPEIDTRRLTSDPARPFLFCAMPFSAEYDDVYFVAMVEAADKNAMTARRVDQDDYAGDVVEHIRRLIHEAALVVADLSEARPNVLYELGYAHGIDKRVVAISSTPLTDLPFDVSHNNTLAYERGRTHQLKGRLQERIRAVMEQ